MPRISALPETPLPDALLPKPPWRRLRQPAGFRLSLTLFAALLLAGSGALLAGGPLSERAEPARRLVSEWRAPVAGAALPLPGFQRRGNFLTARVTTEDGHRLHLVIDVRSNTIVGASALAGEADTGSRQEPKVGISETATKQKDGAVDLIRSDR